MNSPNPDINPQLIERFEAMPDSEKLQFFLTSIIMLLEEDQIRFLIKMLQERLPK